MHDEQKGAIDSPCNQRRVPVFERGRLAVPLVALNDGTLFQRLSATRHRHQSSAFVLSFHHLDDVAEVRYGSSDQEQPIFLGFVLPKKLVKRAVDRNQIKRWARACLRTQNLRQPCAVVIRARKKIVFAAETQHKVREELWGLVDEWMRQICDVKKTGIA